MQTVVRILSKTYRGSDFAWGSEAERENEYDA